VTLDDDLGKMKEYRDRYLRRDKGKESVFTRLSRCVCVCVCTLRNKNDLFILSLVDIVMRMDVLFLVQLDT